MRENCWGNLCRNVYFNYSTVHLIDSTCGNKKFNSTTNADIFFNWNYNSVSFLSYFIRNPNWIIKTTSDVVFTDRNSFYPNNYSNHSLIIHFSIRDTDVLPTESSEIIGEIFNLTYLQAGICWDSLSLKNRRLAIF